MPISVYGVLYNNKCVGWIYKYKYYGELYNNSMWDGLFNNTYVWWLYNYDYVVYMSWICCIDMNMSLL